jgi:O-antigen ligase
MGVSIQNRFTICSREESDLLHVPCRGFFFSYENTKSMYEEKSEMPGTGTDKPLRFLWIAWAAGILILGWGRTTCYWGEKGILSIGGNTAAIVYPLLFIYLVVRIVKHDLTAWTFWKDPLFLFVLFAALSPLWGGLRDFDRVQGYLLPATAGYWIGSYLVQHGSLRVPYLTILVSSISLLVLRGMAELPFIPGSVAIMHSTEEHHTIIAMMIVTAFPLAMALLQVGRLPRPFYYVTLLLLLVGLFLASSRIGWIAFAIVTLLLIWKAKEKKLRAALVAAPVVVVLVMLLLMPHYRERFFTLGSLGGDRETGTRLQNWTLCTELIKEHPFLGISFSNREYYHLGREKDSHFQYEHPHNMVLQVAVSLGIPGLFFFGLLTWTLVRAFRQGMKKEQPLILEGVYISFCGFAIMNMADNVFNSQKALLLFFLLLAYTTWWGKEAGKPEMGEQR